MNAFFDHFMAFNIGAAGVGIICCAVCPNVFIAVWTFTNIVSLGMIMLRNIVVRRNENDY